MVPKREKEGNLFIYLVVFLSFISWEFEWGFFLLVGSDEMFEGVFEDVNLYHVFGMDLDG